MLNIAAEIFWGQAAAEFTWQRSRQEAAGGGLPTEPEAQDQAPSDHLPPSGVGWNGEPPTPPRSRRYTTCVVQAGLALAVKHGPVAAAGTHPGDAACLVMN